MASLWFPISSIKSTFETYIRYLFRQFSFCCCFFVVVVLLFFFCSLCASHPFQNAVKKIEPGGKCVT